MQAVALHTGSLPLTVFERLLGLHPGMGLDAYLFIVPDRSSAAGVDYAATQWSIRSSLPQAAPTVSTLYDVARGITGLRGLPQPRLLMELQTIFNQYEQTSLEAFTQLGDRILAEFNELDDHLLDPKVVYALAADEESIRLQFADFIEPEHQQTLERYFSRRRSAQYDDLVAKFRLLPIIYRELNQVLADRNVGYSGRIIRQAAQAGSERLQEFLASQIPVVLGFNRLSPAQHELINAVLKVAGTGYVFYDVPWGKFNAKSDANSAFFFHRTALFKSPYAIRLDRSVGEPIVVERHLVAGALPMAKALGQSLESIGWERNTTLGIILSGLGDVRPTLSSLPEEMMEHVGLSLGLSFLETPLFGLLEAVAAVHLAYHAQASVPSLLNFRLVMPILEHPILLACTPAPIARWQRSWQEANQVNIEIASLLLGPEVVRCIFNPDQESLLGRFKELLLLLRSEQCLLGDTILQAELEFALRHTQATLALFKQEAALSAPTSWLFFKRQVQDQKLVIQSAPERPVTLCLLGETNIRDFDTLIFLGFNEGAFPPTRQHIGLLPAQIRNAFKLPDTRQDASQGAYQFFRLLNRAKRVLLFENIATDGERKAEPSRLLAQLELEGIQPTIIHYNQAALPLADKPIILVKTPEVMARLSRYLVNGEQGQDEHSAKALFPTHLTKYIECPLRFYLTHIADLAEPSEISEEMDGSRFGNVLHNTISALYEQIVSEKGSSTIQDNDRATLLNRLPTLLDTELLAAYGAGKSIKLDGLGYITLSRRALLLLLEHIIEADMARAPFEIVYNEDRSSFQMEVPIRLEGQARHVRLQGRFDRVDQMSDGSWEVIDFKTGKVDPEVSSLDSLFAAAGGSKKYNKEAFQILLYSILLNAHHSKTTPITPRVVALREIMGQDDALAAYRTFSIQREEITDISLIQAPFLDRLSTLLTEIFNPDVPFTQTPHQMHCQYCSFATLCHKA